ncbi:MAG: hypothetical protein QM714_00205 [Nocardioides sp.]|uniref:hypothetical protein n=1 Tax=Nocardioides sp. TaxID=35761 RepID=UPI0039E51A51
MAHSIAFVDSVSASPTTRLDLNTASLRCTAFDCPPPQLKQAVADNMMTDGGEVSASAYGLRQLRFEHELVQSTEDAWAAAWQSLARELDRETNIIRYLPDGATSPVFFKTCRGNVTDLYQQIAYRKRRVLTFDLLAEPFALGVRESISVGTVTTAQGLFDVGSASIKGDVEAPFVMVDATPHSGFSPATGNAKLRWTLARTTRDASSNPVMTTCGGMTLGTNTTVSSTSALVSFANTSSATRVTWTPSGTTAAAMRGKYRLMIGARGNAVTSSATLTVSVSYGSASVASASADEVTKSMSPLGQQSWLIDCGIVGFDAPDAMTLAPRIEIAAAVSNVTYSRTLYLDWLWLVPVDESCATAGATFLPSGYMPGGGSYPTSSPLVFDGEADDGSGSVYIASSASLWSSATPVLPGWVTYTGALPRLRPGVDNRFAYMRYASGITGTPPVAEFASGSGAITLYYHPRYLYVRPATT